MLDFDMYRDISAYDAEILRGVRDVLCDEHYMLDDDEVVPSAELENDLGLDELDMAEIIMDLQDAFNIAIPRDLSRNLRTVDDLITMVHRAKEIN